MADIATDFVDVKAFRDHQEIIAPELNSLAIAQNPLLDAITQHDGVKGKKVMTQLFIQQMGRRFSKPFNPKPDLFKMKPNILETEPGKFEFAICPQDFEETYLADFKKTKFKNVDEFPFEEYILRKAAEQQNREISDAVFTGVKKLAGQTDDDPLTDLIDGFLELITKGITAGDLTPTPVAGGAYTLANIIENFEAQYDALDDAYQALPIAVVCSPALYKMYMRAYRKEFTSNSEIVRQGVAELDFANARVYSNIAMRGSNRVFMTPLANMNVGYDSMKDVSMWELEKDHRELHFWADFKFGTQFTFTHDNVLSVNDLT